MHIRSILPPALLALTLCAAPASATVNCQGAAGAGKVRLTVTATQLRNAQGEVAVTVYPDDRKRFLAKGGKLLRARVPTTAPATEACFWVVPGHYAVATYHDENGDHDFNRSLFAIKEGFGFSNDAPTTLGIPSFEKVRFAVGAQGTTIRVRTRYSR
jgi:uncharacterized protein (DUF2141 family)